MSAAIEKATGKPILVRALRKSFGEQTVLNGMDLELAPGATCAVLGRSGTGKSVLLKLLIGLQSPDSGSIRINGLEITGLNRDQLFQIRKMIGFLFQQAALYDSLTVAENVAFPLARHTDLSAAARNDRVRELLSSVGMERHAGKLPSQISGGMQKRVGLARALALEPRILLFDEPTAGLDPITAAEIGHLILRLKQEHGLTGIVVTHDIQNARLFSDHFSLLNEGSIVVEGSWEDLEKCQDEFVVQFLRGGP